MKALSVMANGFEQLRGLDGSRWRERLMARALEAFAVVLVRGRPR